MLHINETIGVLLQEMDIENISQFQNNAASVRFYPNVHGPRIQRRS
jgi:hypothetical protein